MTDDIFRSPSLADEDLDGSRNRPAPEDLRTYRSKYEFVIAAAREAERLNDENRKRGIQQDDKVTIIAVERVREGRAKIIYEEPQPVEEESRKESTYFFGPERVEQ